MVVRSCMIRSMRSLMHLPTAMRTPTGKDAAAGKATGKATGKAMGAEDDPAANRPVGAPSLSAS